MSEDNGGDQQPDKNAEENNTPEIEKEEVEFSDEEKSSLDEGSSKKVDSLFAQKKHWRDKHGKTAKDFEDYKKANPVKSETVEPEAGDKPPKKKNDKEENADLRAENQEINLRLDNPELSRAQIKDAVAFAKVRGVKTQEFIKSDTFQAILKADKEKKEAENSTPEPSNRSGGGGSKFTGKETAEEIKAMDEETYTAFDKFMEEKEGSNKGNLNYRRKIVS